MFGASGSVMVRELVLFKSDLTRTAWFRNGDSPPQAVLPGNLRMRWLAREEWRSKPELLDTPPETVEARYQTGDRCLIGSDTDTGRVIYHLWLSETGAYTQWIFKFIDVLPGHVLIHDVWVHPDYRGGNVHWAGASMACQEAVRRRRPGVIAGVEEHEFFLFVAKYARLGLVLIVPYCAVVGIKVFAMKMHFRRTPSRALFNFTRKLQARYPATCMDGDVEKQTDAASDPAPVGIPDR